MQNELHQSVTLRAVVPDDLPFFFTHQLDSTANQMAAFTAKDPTDREAFTAHWSKILDNDAILKMTILFHGEVVGHVLSFEQFGTPAVSYWIGKEHWGKGIATQALTVFLDLIDTRPLYARAAKDNHGSVRVLQKCGFEICGEDKGYSDARGTEVDEYIMIVRS